MSFTYGDAQAVYRAIRGLNPRHDSNGLARPTVQETFNALLHLCERAARTMQVSLMPSEREALRRLVDDLYRSEVPDGQAVRCMSWDYRQVPDLELAKIVAEVSGGAVHVREVDDGSDEVVIAVSRLPLDDAAALAWWESGR